MYHALVAVILGMVVAGSYYLVDRPVSIWARELNPAIIFVFKKITVLGSSGPYLIALVGLYPALRWYLRRQALAKRALFVIAAIVSSGVTVDVLKAVLARWRPIAYFAEPSQYGFSFFAMGYAHNSFPSGHATTVCAVACALTLLYPRGRVLWGVVAVLVAASRVIVGAHYPGDVIAGAWFGVVITLALARSARFREVIAAPETAVREFKKPASKEN